MTGSDFADKLTRVIALAIGFAAVATVIVMARPAGGHGGVRPASLRFSIAQDGAVAATPAAPKPLLASEAMRPGSHASGRVRLRNETGERLAVRLRAQPSSTALDGIAQVRISSDGREIADTTLQALRQGTPGAIHLGPGAAASVRVQAWIPADTENGYEGRQVSVELTVVEGHGK